MLHNVCTVTHELQRRGGGGGLKIQKIALIYEIKTIFNRALIRTPPPPFSHALDSPRFSLTVSIILCKGSERSFT